jgi:hypothetical protein
MAQITAERLSANPAFHELVTVATEFATAHGSVVRDMDLQQRRAYADQANALSAEVKSGAASKRREGFFRDLGALVGFAESDVHALLTRAQTAGQEFVAAFPEFAATDEQTKVDTLILALKHDHTVVRAARRMVAPAQTDGAAAVSQQECEASCLIFFILFVTAAIVMFIIGIVGCILLGWIPPLMILCMAAATALLLAFLAIALDIYKACLANCQGGDGGGGGGGGQPD